MNAFFRYKRRSEGTSQERLIDKKENRQFISDFEEWLSTRDMERNGDKSTIKKHSGHLFNYHDSLLVFNSKKYEDYHLQKHVTKDVGPILEVCNPTLTKQWIQSLGGGDGKQFPARRREALKAHATFREYVYERISLTSFGPSVQERMDKEMILKNLNEIGNHISKRKVYQQLDRLEKNDRQKTQLARKILFPDENFNEHNAVSIWLSSKEAQIEEEKYLNIYEKAMSGLKPSSKDFTSFAHYARFNLAIVDKNRRGVYNFSNEDFAGRAPRWLPGANINDDNTADEYDMIPDGWNPNKPPEVGMEPSCYVVTAPGDGRGMKLGQSANIIITKKVLDILLKYRDMKRVVFGTVKISEPFFVNFKADQLGPLQRTKGSLLDKMGNVVGADKLTVNASRRAAERSVQGSPKLKEHIKVVQSHSQEVGLKNYYRAGEVVRAQFISNLSEKESPIAIPKDKVTDTSTETRENIEKEERESIVKKAKEKLREDKLRKNFNYKLNPKDRSSLQNLFSLNENIENSSKFPGEV